MSKCGSCTQVLGWNSIKKENEAKGVKKAALEFEVPMEFTIGDCRKCPLSYIARESGENVYECPLNMRSSCKLQVC
jgi:hypothetical protein